MLNLFFIRQCLPPGTTFNPDTSTAAEPHCLDLSPIVKHMLTPFYDSIKQFAGIRININRLVRALMTGHSNPSAPPNSHPTATAWTKFWKTSLHPTLRNIWYRLVHNKAPVKSFPHRVFPDIHSSPNCDICPNLPANTEHVFVTCPQRWSVWASILLIFNQLQDLSKPEQQSIIIQGIFQLKYQGTITTLPHCNFIQLLGSTIHSIWLSLLNKIFRDITFHVDTTTKRIQHTIASLLIEQDEDMDIPKIYI
ncbi:hypothetical protein INT47_010110 [Mucor saturninus]|uniref:Reverse transcriptase zinc-binding domain-containing protein n=1 Tax=Mucor saturninus TaxID=64648 RepID=A0A8H7R3Y7_9FUNG|nr:hypothetical protein INT47_010110 [Mucor saturninus]